MTNRSDNFNRTDSSSTIQSPSDGGANYTIEAGTWGINTNLGYKVATVSTHEAISLEASTPNVEVSFVLPNTNFQIGNGGVAARVADNNNLLYWQVSLGTSASLFKKVAGSYTQLGATYTATFNTGDVMKIRCDNANLITAYQNAIAAVSVTEASGSSNTRHGLSIFSLAAGTNPFYVDTLQITDISPVGSTPRRLMLMGAGA